MSNYCINIRILFWHIQLTTYKKFRFSFNRYWWSWKVIRSPLAVYEFDLSRWGSESLGGQMKTDTKTILGDK